MKYTLPLIMGLVLFLAACTATVPEAELNENPCTGQETENYCYFTLTVNGTYACSLIIGNDPMRDSCLVQAVKHDPQDIYCKAAGNKEGQCYAELGIALNDLSYCDNAKNKVDQGHCINTIAQQQNDSALCQNIHSEALRNNCYYYFGTTANSIGFCQNITTNQHQRYGCIDIVARQTSNPDACHLIREYTTELLEDIYATDRCIITMARDNNNTELCNEVEDNHYLGCLTVVIRERGILAECDAIPANHYQESCKIYVQKRIDKQNTTLTNSS